MIEYRDDDRRDVGFCPKCWRRLSSLSYEGKGFCELHSWVFAEFNRPPHLEDDHDPGDEEIDATIIDRSHPAD